MMTRKILFGAVCCFWMAVSAAQTLNTAQIAEDINSLSSDQLSGRKPGTKGCDDAANFIRDRFKAGKLILLGDHGFQYFDVVTEIKAGDNNAFLAGEKKYQIQTDYIPFSFSSNATVSGNVVFAGYGFDFDKDTVSWHDYKNLDVKGKWVILLRGNPEPENENSIFSAYSKERSKVLVAKDKGAAGVLFVTGILWDKNDELVNLYYDKTKAGSGIPVINIKRSLANVIIAGNGQTIEALEAAINKERGGHCFSTGVAVTATTDLQYTTVRTQNVVAMAPGSDPLLKNEYIVLGAHYDHLGMGGPGSGTREPDTLAIHNGADDNASGVAAVIDLATRVMQPGKAFKRSVIFVAFSAEEMGLLGSSWFVGHLPVDKKKVILMMNFDMIGRLAPEKKSISIGGTGTFTQSDSILHRCLSKSDLKPAFSPEGYGPSDHAAFYSDSIPVLYFTTGAHQDYHTSKDDAEFINTGGIAMICDLAQCLMIQVDGIDTMLTYQEAGPKEKSRQGGALKVRLGIMPDFVNTDVTGVPVGAVTKGGPAEQGGILKGDIITALDGKPVQNIYDYMDRLKTFSPGQTISVDVERGGQKKVFLVLL